MYFMFDLLLKVAPLIGEGAMKEVGKLAVDYCWNNRQLILSQLNNTYNNGVAQAKWSWNQVQKAYQKVTQGLFQFLVCDFPNLDKACQRHRDAIQFCADVLKDSLQFFADILKGDLWTASSMFSLKNA